MCPTVAVLHHLESPFTGHAGRAFEAAGIRIEHRDLRRSEALPAAREFDGLVSLGGEQSVRELGAHGYLEAEVGLLREAAEAGTPVLGVCLGGQLLAHALGARIVRLPRRTVGWRELRPLQAARADPCFSSLPEPAMALHWNEDCFSLPPGAVELAAPAGPACEAFRHGDVAWGIQFHPEVDADVLETWYRSEAGWLEDAGVSEAEARAADARHLDAQASLGAALFGAFAAVVRERASARVRAG